jgi:hypothetical protein
MVLAEERLDEEPLRVDLTRWRMLPNSREATASSVADGDEPRNPSLGGGEKGRRHEDIHGTSRRSRFSPSPSGLLVQSPPASPFPAACRRRLLYPPPVAAVASPLSLVFPFHDQKHGVDLVGEKTRG